MVIKMNEDERRRYKVDKKCAKKDIQDFLNTIRTMKSQINSCEKKIIVLSRKYGIDVTLEE